MITAALTQADRLAESQFESNLDALRARQPRLVPWLEDEALAWEWLFARDGTLSGRDPAGRWIGGCSVPTRLSQIVLNKLEIRGSVACFLVPNHGSDLRVAIGKLDEAQALIAVLPTHGELATLLHCLDFSREIRSGRLYFAAGRAWDVELERLFVERPNLPTPSSFIRLPASDESIIEPLLKGAQAIFQASTERRTAEVAQMRENYVAPRGNKLCIVAPMRFRLWNDFGRVVSAIQDASTKLSVQIFDTDDPANAAPHALVSAACASDVLMTVNTARADLPGLIPSDLPWISWITGSRIPSGSLAGDNDRLLISHPSLQAAAERAGWPLEQIQVADWPDQAAHAGRGKTLSLICDTALLDTPADLSGYSSHLVLWETIRNELLSNPFLLRKVDDYLQRHLDALGIVDSAFSHSRFIEQLIVPAYAQGLSRTLAAAKVPVKVWGRGWSSIEGFQTAGEVVNRDQLERALDTSAALIHPLVARVGHPILRSGLPTIAATDAAEFIQLARQALSGRMRSVGLDIPSISAEMLERIVLQIAN